MDCKECKLDRYKELAKRRDLKIQKLKEEKHQLLEEIGRVCHENKLLWGYWHTTQDRALDDGEVEKLRTEKECMDWQINEYDLEVKRLEAELDEAVDIAATLTEALGIIVKLGERLKNCPCRKEPVENG